MKTENLNEDDTYKVLRGYTFEEIVDIVTKIPTELGIGSHMFEHGDKIDPHIRKYGWTMKKILNEIVIRNSGKLDERYG